MMHYAISALVTAIVIMDFNYGISGFTFWDGAAAVVFGGVLFISVLNLLRCVQFWYLNR